MTVVRLAYSPRNIGTLIDHAAEGPVNLLVSYDVIDQFLKRKDELNIGSWVLDSGAFAVWNSGRTIDNKDFIACAKEMAGEAEEVYGLDVIGSFIATAKNLEEAWADGVPAIPTFHRHDDWKWLDWCCRKSPTGKIAIGGLAGKGRTGYKEWLQKVFALCWPRPIHAFAYASWEAVKTYPFHSSDSSSWFTGGARFGTYSGYTGRPTYIGARLIEDFWGEVLEYQRRERYAKAVWRKQLIEVQEVLDRHAES